MTHLVFAWMSFVEEAFDVVGVVPEDGLEVSLRRRECHGDDPFGDVGQVEVDAFVRVDQPPSVLGDQSAQEVGHVSSFKLVMFVNV